MRSFCWGLLALAVLAPAANAATLDLSAYKGKVVYLDFWASWCGPCKLSFPYMERLAYYYSKQPFVIVAVNVDHSRAKADAFLSTVNARFPIVYDPRGVIAAHYGVKAMPTSILIGRDGRVRYVDKGFFAEQMPIYESHIAELINDKP